jgi:alginate O-acetyltransferase complex protein AlgI
MVTSLSFWTVLAVAVAAYWMLGQGRTSFLAIISFLFLLTLDAGSILGLAGWAALFYYLAPYTRQNDRKAIWLFYGLLSSLLGFLAWFKYVQPLLCDPVRPRPLVPDFFYDASLGPAIPLGISYFTFKLIHYLIEESRGNIHERSPQSFFLYLVLFPIVPAGPIERYDRFVQCRDQHWSLAAMVEGITRIQWGLIKKFFIAEVVILPLIQWPSTSAILQVLDQVPPMLVWLHLAGYFLYAYMDFSGYTDIAIGASRLFGFRICENFNYPLLATNIGDFWKRWHMSLSSWCQAYVYMPTLGLTRQPYVAVYATMAAIGLWHAGSASWLFWGLYHASGIVVFLGWNRLKRRHNIGGERSLISMMLARVITLSFIVASFAFIATERHGGLVSAFRLQARLFGIDLP